MKVTSLRYLDAKFHHLNRGNRISCWIHEWRGRPGCRHQPGLNRWPVLAAATCDNARWAGVWSSTLLQEDLRKLEAFHMRCQRMILGIRWHDFVRNTEVVDGTNLPSVRDVIAKRRNSLLGHVVRHDDQSAI